MNFSHKNRCKIAQHIEIALLPPKEIIVCVFYSYLHNKRLKCIIFHAHSSIPPIYFIKLPESNWLDYIIDIIILSNCNLNFGIKKDSMKSIFTFRAVFCLLFIFKHCEIISIRSESYTMTTIRFWSFANTYISILYCAGPYVKVMESVSMWLRSALSTMTGETLEVLPSAVRASGGTVVTHSLKILTRVHFWSSEVV